MPVAASFRDSADGAKHSPPKQPAHRPNGEPIGKEHDQRIAIRTIHPRLRGQKGNLPGWLGDKAEQQLCGPWRIAAEKYGRTIDGDQPEVGTPEPSDQAGDDLPVTVSRQWGEGCRAKWRRPRHA